MDDSVPQQLCHPVQLLHMLRHDLGYDDDGNAKQQPPNAPQPTPEQQRYEHGRCIHVGDFSGHPGGHQDADEGRDRDAISVRWLNLAEREGFEPSKGF